MKVKVIKSSHPDINPGMIGEAVATSLDGFEVTFLLYRPDPLFNRRSELKDVTVWMTRDQIEDANENSNDRPKCE